MIDEGHPELVRGYKKKQRKKLLQKKAAAEKSQKKAVKKAPTHGKENESNR